MEGPRTLHVELLYAGPPDISGIKAELVRSCPQADVGGDAGVHVFHRDAPMHFKDGSVPSSTVFAPVQEITDRDRFAGAIGQSWNWDGAREALGRSTHAIIALEMMASGVERKLRLDVFLRALAGAVRATRPIALAWRSADKLVDPSRFLEAFEDPNPAERLFVAINVRLFRISDRPGEMVMDTRGLAEFMLPELQVHFHDLEPSRVATHLYNSASYLWDKGDVIEDGHTIQGLTPDQRWRCQHEEALVKPERVVLDLDPGPPFAAGKRGKS